MKKKEIVLNREVETSREIASLLKKENTALRKELESLKKSTNTGLNEGDSYLELEMSDC